MKAKEPIKIPENDGWYQAVSGVVTGNSGIR
jgi:hypothetical protein